MGDCEGIKRILNPLALHLQKMEVELKCPLCLNLLSRPLLLPCDHTFCRHCIATAAKNRSDCPACKLPFIHQDLRDSVHMETMVSIYRSMNAAFGANFLQQGCQLDISETGMDVKMPSSESPVSSKSDAVETLREERMQGVAGEKWSSLHSLKPMFGRANSQKPRGEKTNEVAPHSNRNCKKFNGEALIDQDEPTNPASYADLKDSDHKRGGQRSKHSTETQSMKRLLRKELSIELDERAEIDREPKRLKLGSQSCAQAKKDGVAKGFSMSSSDSEIERGCPPSFLPQLTSSSSGTDVFVQCVFCHSSTTIEASGRMLHFLNGKPIMADQVCQPNIFHVHEKCVDWAPQVYFEGENAMNLEPEVSRAAKIKCSSCGMKGAALGCYVKSCRKSYHVPCALEISECRWDSDNFVMLCPSHSSHKLPCDKTMKKKTTNPSTVKMNSSNLSEDLNPATKPQLDGLWTDPLGLVGDWVLCGSALCKEDKELLEKFVSLTGAPVAKAWKQNFTHVIASTDERGACNRTLKIFIAILTGKWVLSINWIRACMEAGYPVPEEHFEISHDVQGSFDGPRNGRVRVMQKAPKLFAHLKFYLSGYYMPYYKCYLEDLIKIAGGTIIQKSDIQISEDSNVKEISPTSFIIYSVDPPQGCNPDDLAEALKKRAKEAEDLAAQTGSCAVRHTLLLDSIASCSLQLDQ